MNPTAKLIAQSAPSSPLVVPPSGGPSSPSSPTITEDILHMVLQERARQDALVAAGKLPFNCADPMIDQGGDHALKLAVLGEEFGEVAKEVYELSVFESEAEDPLQKLRTELIQVAAVAVAWAESLPSPSVPSVKSVVKNPLP